MRRPHPVHLIAFLVLYCCSTSALAQATASFGFQAGLNFANASTSPASISTSSRTGVMVGAQIEIGLSNILSIQTELFYIQKGAEFNISSGGTSTTATWKFDYVEVPVLLKARFGSAKFKPFIFAGPNFGVTTKAEGEVKVGSESQTVDLKDQIESSDITLDFGAGVEYQVSSTTTLIGSIRYSLGLNDIDKDNTASWKSTGVQLVVGAKFSL